LIEKDVLLGKEDWLFLFKGGQYQFDYLLGTKEVDTQSITNFAENLISRKAFCDAKNISYKHIVFPSKPLLKGRYLPDEYKNVQSLFERYYLQELLEKTQGKASDFTLYLLDILKELEARYSTYKKYDTHMTCRANFDITNHLINELDSIIETIKPTEILKRNISGDLCSIISIFQKNDEEYIALESKHIYEIENLYFLKTYTNQVIITHNPSALTSQRLLIFGTSSMEKLMMYLKHYFLDILFIRSSFMHYDIVELYQPDVIFTASAERYLSNVDSDKDANNFLLDLYADISYKPSHEYLEAFKAQMSFAYAPHRYEKWKNKIEESPFLKLDEYKFNKFLIQDTHNPLKFKSTGIDPSIIYHNVNFKSMARYRFTCKLVSSVDSLFQIYYSDSRLPKDYYTFSENYSIKREIFKGLNLIEIILDFEFIGNKFRIDPMQTVGEFEIITLTLEEIGLVENLRV